MKSETDYEKEKQIKKQALVRNEFMSARSGKYDFPIIKKQEINLDKIELLSFVDAKKEDNANKHKTIHFFTYDWKFEKVYENAEEEFEKLRQYACLLSPDFSVFTNMPLALQIESVFKNRWCGAYWQSKGMKVIPTISWGDERSFDFCFDGVEEGSLVAVSTYYLENCEEEFMLGYNKMLEKIKPSAVLCYDEPFKSMKGDVKEFLPTTYEWTKNLSAKDMVQFMWEKHHRNVSGLNANEFKFFNYDDPYARDNIVKCSICGHVALCDQFGNGECSHCGWKFSKDEDDFEKKMGVSYPLLVTPSRAREQYKKGLPFRASFEEFINGLIFYGEMLFTHNGVSYEVFLDNDKNVHFCSQNLEQTFPSTGDFKKNANINGHRLCDIWEDEVTWSGYMYCE